MKTSLWHNIVAVMGSINLQVRIFLFNFGCSRSNSAASLIFIVLFICLPHTVTAKENLQHSQKNTSLNYSIQPDVFSDPADGIIKNHQRSKRNDLPDRNQIVHIHIKALLNSGSVKEYGLITQQDVEKLTQDLPLFGKKIMVNITNNFTNHLSLLLQRNPFSISKNFVRKYFSKTGKPIVKYGSNSKVPLVHCYFNGEAIEDTSLFASLSLCGGIKGVILISGSTYLIEPVSIDSKLIHVMKLRNLSREDEPVSRTCDTNDDATNVNGSHSYENRRKFVREVRLPAGANPTTRYVEIYAVADNSFYTQMGSVDAVIMRMIEIFNFAAGVYRPLNIYLALVGVEVWNDGNKITYNKFAGGQKWDSNKLLIAFAKYRGTNINFNTKNDNGQLFTRDLFEANRLGLGNTKSVCTQLSSASINSDKFPDNYASVAATMSHELGHNLGLPHTNTYIGQTCECYNSHDPSYTGCIMDASAPSNRINREWSQCSIDKLQENFFQKDLDACLKDKPDEIEKVGNTAACGNLFVEQGEECDCGLPENCKSKCCNPHTCKLFANATCATGPCCDLEKCSIHLASFPCRSMQDTECDLEEFCEGDTEWCPPDSYKADGTDCNNRGEGYCHSGKCSTHDSQCHFIWRVQSAAACDDWSYENNDAADDFGNCGWDTVGIDETSGYPSLKREYKQCKKESDKFCGLLFCQYDGNEILAAKRKPDRPHIESYLITSFFRSRNSKSCGAVSFDVGYKEQDPGQVPNGAKCGDNSMCVDSECVPVPKPPDHCNCSGRGVCNQLNLCYCEVGWAPPLCDKKGEGGTIKIANIINQPSTNEEKLHLAAVLMAVFGGVIPMTIILAVVLFRRKNDIRRRMRGLYNRMAKGKKNSGNSPNKKKFGNPLSKKFTSNQPKVEDKKPGIFDTLVGKSPSNNKLKPPASSKSAKSKQLTNSKTSQVTKPNQKK